MLASQNWLDMFVEKTAPESVLEGDSYFMQVRKAQKWHTNAL